MTDDRDPTAALIDALERGGELVDEGGFDIDVARGLAKLARFALAEPRAYVLRLVEAGLCAGAGRIEIDLRRRALELRFIRNAPIVIPAATLNRLLTVLVGRSPDLGGVDREVLVQLAIGTLGALQASAREVVIESVAEDGAGWRVRVTAGEGQHGEQLVDATPGTRIRVAGLELEREAELLERHCAWVASEIWLDRELISGKPLAPGVWISSRNVELDGARIGEAGVFESARWGEIRVLSRGLLIETYELPTPTRGVFANLELRELPRDLSRTKLSKSERLEQALVAADQAIAALPLPRAPAKLPPAAPPATTGVLSDPLDLAILMILAGWLAVWFSGATLIGYVVWLVAVAAVVKLWKLVGGDKQ